MLRRILFSCAALALIAVLFAAAPESSNSGEAARLNNLGEAYMNQQLFEKGLKEFTDAAAADPKFSRATVNRGIALFGMGRLDEAKKILEEVSKSDPKDPHVWYNLGLIYKNNSDAQAAVDAFKRVTEIDPDDADTWYFLGTAYVQIKQFPEAIAAFQHAIKLDQYHASAEFGLSRAYQQSGDSTTAREHLKRFQFITQNKLGSAITLAYGEQGKYSKVEASPNVVEKVPPQIAVKFVDVTEEAELKVDPKKTDSGSALALQGTGACFLDYDSDGHPDLFLANNGAQGGMSLYHNLGNGKFEDVTKQMGLDEKLRAAACTAGDYDNDGAIDLAVIVKGSAVLYHNEKGAKFKNVTDAAQVKPPDVSLPVNAAGRFGWATGLTFVDYDHDGDLDLYVTVATQNLSDNNLSEDKEIWSETAPVSHPNIMWRNNGNGTFTQADGLEGPGSSTAAVGSDYNNDRAIDLIVAGGPKAPVILENPREGPFLPRTPWNVDAMPRTRGIAVLDFNHDGWMDIAFTHNDNPGLTLWKNSGGHSFDQIVLPETNWAHGFGLAAFDYDNDGWVDLVAVGETKDGKGEIRLFRNLGPDGWKDVTTDVGLDKIQLKDPRAIIIGDYDGDGATDLLITQNDGPAVLLRNEGGNKNNWLKLDLKGLADNRSAIGAKVEVFSGVNRQKFEIAGSNGYLGQNSLELNVGLGQAKQADVVRMLWPTGVLQDEVEVPANQKQVFSEIDRRGSSCPTLFAWDGQHYELVADMIGAGVVGHWVAPGERNIARPIEYVKLDRDTLYERDGKLSFRLMEPMEEVVYLDQVGLLAVDHPAGFDVFPNEYFASNPPYPPFKIVASRNAQPPAAVRDEHGHDLLPDLLAHKYVGDFALEPFKGFAKMHSLDLDLGKPYNGGPLWLLLSGEIEYFTATGMYAADQAGIKAVSPYVEALNPQGKWVRVMDDMGFPAGGPRTMTADLTGKLPPGTQRIRISTNLQIYWNSILVDRTPQKQDVRLTPVALQSANLGFHGYPRQTESQPPGVVKYVYEQVSRTGPYARAAGTYTRYGDVLPLLTGFDDKLAVFGSGEEVALEFDASKLSPLPAGWTRDYFFFANGYEKDMDFYAAHGDTVWPLPFRAMGTYPYPKDKAFPLDDQHLDYMLKYNTRQVSGNEPQGYSFQYEKK